MSYCGCYGGYGCYSGYGGYAGYGNGYGNTYYASGNGYASSPVIVYRQGNGSGDPSVTPQTDREREAIRRVLEELRKKDVPANAAQVTVRVPANSRLYVDNVAVPLTNGSRTFNTPKLEPGRQYYYTMRLETNRGSQTVRENRQVEFAAGQRIEVDFTTALTATARR